MANFDHFAVLVNLCISFYKQYVNSPTTFVWYFVRFYAIFASIKP